MYEAKGCKRYTRISGTNGGQMQCGAMLRELDGTEHRQLCAQWEQGQDIQRAREYLAELEKGAR